MTDGSAPGEPSTFLCTLRPVRAEMPDNPTPEEGEAVAAHFAYYERLLAEGVLILAGRTLNDPCVGLFVFRASDQADAESIVSNDPAIRQGVMNAMVQPFNIALLSR